MGNRDRRGHRFRKQTPPKNQKILIYLDRAAAGNDLPNLDGGLARHFACERATYISEFDSVPRAIRLTRAFDDFVDKPKLLDRGRRQHKRIKIRQPHAAIQ